MEVAPKARLKYREPQRRELHSESNQVSLLPRFARCRRVDSGEHRNRRGTVVIMKGQIEGTLDVGRYAPQPRTALGPPEW